MDARMCIAAVGTTEMLDPLEVAGTEPEEKADRRYGLTKPGRGEDGDGEWTPLLTCLVWDGGPLDIGRPCRPAINAEKDAAVCGEVKRMYRETNSAAHFPSR